MKQATTLLLASVGAAAAQTSTKSDVVAPFPGNSSFHASMLDAEPAATTYILGCQVDEAEDGCTVTGGSGWEGLTLISGPSTVAVHHTLDKSNVHVTSDVRPVAGTVKGDKKRDGLTCLHYANRKHPLSSIGYEGYVSGGAIHFQEPRTQSGKTLYFFTRK